MLLACSTSGCASRAPAEPKTLEAKSEAAQEAEPAERELSAEEALARADELYLSQLSAAARDERFAVDRQVSTLLEAITLYELFLERANKDAKTMILVQRSRERIRDAEETIASLRASAVERP